MRVPVPALARIARAGAGLALLTTGALVAAPGAAFAHDGSQEQTATASTRTPGRAPYAALLPIAALLLAGIVVVRRREGLAAA